MYRILLIGMAGLAGTLTRYWLSGWIGQRFGETFPTGTLMVNLSGCFLIGFFYQLFEERVLIDPITRTAILVGFLGGYTTFSSFALKLFTLLRQGEVLAAVLNGVDVKPARFDARLDRIRPCASSMALS